MLFFIEQLLNGLQLGIMLFLMSAGLTLVFGIMQVINLAHGSFYMIGAYVGATVTARTGSFILGILAALPAAALAGMAVEALVLRRLYKKDHLDQVLATFGLIMFFNELTRIIWGRQPLSMDVPAWLSGSVEFIPGIPYPSYRLAVIAVGLEERADMPAANLSHGEKRQLEVGMALAGHPKMLLLDEPYASMGPGGAVELTRLIKRLKTELHHPAGGARHGRGLLSGRSHLGAGLRAGHRQWHT